MFNSVIQINCVTNPTRQDTVATSRCVWHNLYQDTDLDMRK